MHLQQCEVTSRRQNNVDVEPDYITAKDDDLEHFPIALSLAEQPAVYALANRL